MFRNHVTNTFYENTKGKNYEQPHSATITFFQWVTLNLVLSSSSKWSISKGSNFLGLQHGRGIRLPLSLCLVRICIKLWSNECSFMGLYRAGQPPWQKWASKNAGWRIKLNPVISLTLTGIFWRQHLCFRTLCLCSVLLWSWQSMRVLMMSMQNWRR